MKLSTLNKADHAAYTRMARQVRQGLLGIAKKQSPGAPPEIPRKRVPRDPVQEKTDGHCHMCGDSLGESWKVGHVKPYRGGGNSTVKNCLPICADCNRLRWNYRPEVLRFMLLFGRYAKQAIRGKKGRPTALGEELIKLHVRNTWSNRKRAQRE